jgi:HEAT repeat protein
VSGKLRCPTVLSARMLTMSTRSELPPRWLELLRLDDAQDPRIDALILALQSEGDPQVVGHALALLGDRSPRRRALAADVLSQFGFRQGRPFGDRIAPALAEAARRETDPTVRVELVGALGCAEDPAWVAELVSYAADPDPAVRLSVARNLPLMFGGSDLDEDAVTALLVLTTDVDPAVRDWATFGLAQSDLEAPALTDALLARVDDPGGDTAAEAVLGLARRGHPRARELLLHRLDVPAEEVWRLDLQAAAALADPALLPVLRSIAADFEADGADPEWTRRVEFALGRCDENSAAEAAVLEREIVAWVNHELHGTGRSVTTSGAYPRTSIVVLGPDGVVDPANELLWDGTTPSTILISQAAGSIVHWVTSIDEQ